MPDASRAAEIKDSTPLSRAGDCCIHPPGRYEMIAVTPPVIFSKEVAQNGPPHLPRQQSAYQNSFSQISGDEDWMKI